MASELPLPDLPLTARQLRRQPAHRLPTVLYRAHQFVAHLRTKQPYAAPPWLTPAEAALFEQMAPPDQQECLAVAETLRAWGFADDRELLAAAALHDLGKALALPNARYRVAVTVLETVAPPLLAWLAKRSATFGVLA
ncbi:MAG: hypothetical protein KGJ86_23305, partial [Chloroflexota bacterium]|nr:hypothetical protein [Chloroflexota bacterium]